MEKTTDDFSKYLLLMQKAHENQISAVRDEGNKWRQLYEKEHSVATNLQQQLNIEVERLKKLLNIAETKIAEKDKVISEKDKLIVEKDRMLSQLISESASINEVAPNDIQHNSHPRHDSGTTSPSLLEDGLLLPTKRTSEDNDLKWNKRKKRKQSKQTNRLKQITLTQHQSTRLSLSLRKTDRSISVIPQSPVIDLSTIPSDEGSDGDTTDEYSSSNDFVNQNLINQDHGTVNTTVSQDQGSQDSQNYDTASQSLDNGDNSIKNQDFIPVDQDDSPSQDNNFYERNGDITANHTNILISQDSEASQDYNLTHGTTSQSVSGNRDHTFVHGDANLTDRNQDFDYTFAPEVITNAGPHTISQNSTGSQDQDAIGQKQENQREQSKTTAGSRYVATVRKRSDRQKLDAAPCRECAEWYAGDPSMAKQTCRHRYVHPPVNTPADFWKIGFPDTPAE